MNQNQETQVESTEIDFESDEPIQAPACSLDGEGDCESCQ